MVTLVEDYIVDDINIRRAQIIEVVVSHCAHVLWSKKPEKLKLAGAWAQSLKNTIRRHKDRLTSAVSHRHQGVSGGGGNIVVGGGGGGGVSVSLLDSPARGTESITSTPSTGASASKRGNNGLTVASADVILCKEPPRHRSERRGLTSTTVGEGSSAIGEAEGSVTGSRATPASSPASGPSSACAAPSGEATTAAVTTAGEKESLPETTPSGTGPSPPVMDADGAFYLYRDGTAAATRDGGIVYVAATGSPLEDSTTEHVEQRDFHAVPVHVKRLSGGITNELFHVYDEEDPGCSVVVRVYGKETERVISRESELFYQSLFLDTYVHGRNFLVYKYLDQYETLPYTDMTKEADHIAVATANLQVRATLAARADTAPPLIDEDLEAEGVQEDTETKKKASRVDTQQDAEPRLPRFERESNYMVHSLTTWVDQVTSAEIEGKVQPGKLADYRDVARQLREASATMLRYLEQEKASLGEAVCHNDLLSANVMRHVATGNLKIIDFDYTKRDFFLFDLANHFNEYTGLECDYARYFPTDEHMARFVARYRQAVRDELAAAHVQRRVVSASDEIFPGEWELFWGGNGVATCAKGVYDTSAINAEAEAAVVAHWTELVKLLSVCSNLSWSIWSLVQEAVSELDVDFLDYAKLRLNRYYETKDEFLKAFAKPAE